MKGVISMRLTQKSKIFACVLAVCLVMSLSVCVFADDLNGVGSTQTEVTTPVNTAPTTGVEETVPNTEGTGSPAISLDIPKSSKSIEETEETAKAVGDMFSKAGPDAKDFEQAEQFIEPFAQIINKVMAVILGVTSLLMMFVTVLDLLYMAFPPVRDMLDGGRMGAMAMGPGVRGSRGMGGMRGGYGMRGGMGMGGGYGMGGMNGMGMGGMNGMGMGGMNGMGMGGNQMQQQQQIGGGLSAVGRWVSDEAIAACLESQGGIAEGMPGMSGTPVKPMLLSYIKKRSLFLILFGICLILFTSTVFTDLGVRVGTWILRIISGFGS